MSRRGKLTAYSAVSFLSRAVKGLLVVLFLVALPERLRRQRHHRPRGSRRRRPRHRARRAEALREPDRQPDADRRPAGRIGDFCRFGDSLGTVEEIGIRSTRIRTLDRTVLTVPNGEFSSLHIENYTQRDRYWFHPTLNLRYETTPDQIRYLLRELRAMLFAHPKVDPDPARVRFIALAAIRSTSRYSPTCMRATTRVPGGPGGPAAPLHGDRRGGGSGFAFPSQTLYLGRDGGLDEAKAKEAEETRGSALEKGELEVPRFRPETIREPERLDPLPAARLHGRRQTEALTPRTIRQGLVDPVCRAGRCNLYLASRGCAVRQENNSRGLIDLRELSLTGPVGPDIRRPPTRVGSRDRNLQRPRRPCVHSSKSPRLERQEPQARMLDFDRQQGRTPRPWAGAAGGDDGRGAARRRRARAVARLRPLVRHGETVSLFWPMRDEIDPRGLIDDIHQAGGSGRHAGRREAKDVLPPLRRRGLPRARRLRHPPSECRPADVDPDFIVAPLAAFDRKGGRIGYGAGHYDSGDRRPSRARKAPAPRRHRLRLPGGRRRAARAARRAPSDDRDGARADRSGADRREASLPRRRRRALGPHRRDHAAPRPDRKAPLRLRRRERRERRRRLRHHRGDLPASSSPPAPTA